MKAYLAKVAEALQRVEVGELESAVRILEQVKQSHGVVWIVGNGGSAATAEHLANDLVKVGHLRSIALPSLFSTMTAYGNDCGWDMQFAEFLLESAKPEDCLVAISCSGNSPNVWEAARLFHHNRLIVLTGRDFESRLAELEADARVFVLDPDIRVQEDTHLAVCHAIVGRLG